MTDEPRRRRHRRPLRTEDLSEADRVLVEATCAAFEADQAARGTLTDGDIAAGAAEIEALVAQFPAEVRPEAALEVYRDADGVLRTRRGRIRPA